MPFLRLTRDQRGYENTFLLHVDHPGERPRVLYWYRSAPGVRVGRPPLDEDAIRTIEEQHPEIEFDWPQILEAGTMLPAEVEQRPERPRRKPSRPREQDALAAAPDVSPPLPDAAAALDTAPVAVAIPEQPPARPAEHRDILEELVGREIAARLRTRYADISARIQNVPDPANRRAWQLRADALNPDSWVTPEDILHGVQHADALFDELRRELT